LVSRARFLKVIQVLILNPFNGRKVFFGEGDGDIGIISEGACLNKPPLFCGMNYELWCIRMKFFVESIDRKI